VAEGLPVTLREVHRIPGGLSAETYLLTVEWEAPSGRVCNRYVLRRDPIGGLVERDIEREYRVMEALSGGPVPLPRVLGLEMDPAWLERPFFIDEFLPGVTDRNLFNAPSFELARRRLGEQFLQVLATMHSLDIDAAGLGFLPKPSHSPAEHEIDLWEDLVARLQQEPSPLLVEAFAWMRAHAPEAPRLSLVHGEYRPGNFLFQDDRFVAVVDWEYAHLGDPVEDVGWACMKQYRIGDKESGMFPRDEFVKRYEAFAGFTVDRDALHFWEVFSNVKVIGIYITGQHAFHSGKMDTAMINSGKTSDVFAEVARLIGL
jgi:aminoglycoside phosphotransferase (APT) family kinase protein